MAEGPDSRRRPAAGRRSRPGAPRRSGTSRVILEKVLGISTTSGSGLTSDPNSGLIAYPAGCVIVLFHPKKKQQSHIINTSRKPFTAVAFSHDGKHLVTGESGHMPCVRVWEVGGVQVSEVQSHKFGVSCVAFSSNSCFIVSVGFQHDMTVSVWDWRKGSIVASNKVSSRVSAVSFSQDDSYFVTAGNRHLKFWYLDASKERRVNSTVPLIGRSGLLGEHKNSEFSGVACGRGRAAAATFCITTAGLMCRFNSSRQLEAWVDLKAASASCLVVSEDLIFCGCADGLVRVFCPSNLQYLTTLQRPHPLGVDLRRSSPSAVGPGAQFPDTVALTFDPSSGQLATVFADHSLYVWEVNDLKNLRTLFSAMFHSSCVWNVQVYPDLSDRSQCLLPPSSFLTCSSDNTIRVWTTDPLTTDHNTHTRLCSKDLCQIVYVDENVQHLQAGAKRAESGGAGADGKSGIRVMGISPDGRHLAAGDRCGNLRIFSLEFFDELLKIKAHDSEVLCLEFSPTSTGVKLLASASRDRLIHVFSPDRGYSLEQTLSDHSAAITALKFTGESPEVRIVSCGADKSVYFQTSEQTAEGATFSRSHHVVEKTLLYDMDLDPDPVGTRVAVACQDRHVRVYDVDTGKMSRCLKGSSSDEGALLKLHLDPSGTFFATSSSDKNISVCDYDSGECVASLIGHAEIVTGMRFSQDCRHLITVSGDGCIFVWRLDPQMTAAMRRRRGLRLKAAPETHRHKASNIRRETFIAAPSSQLRLLQEEGEPSDLRTPDRPDSGPDVPPLQTNGKMPLWFRKTHAVGGASVSDHLELGPGQRRCRWTEQTNPVNICTNWEGPGEGVEFPPQSPESHLLSEEEEDEEFHPQSLESLLEDKEEGSSAPAGEDGNSYILPPHSQFPLEVKGQGAGPVWSVQLSPDSAFSEGLAGSTAPLQDTDLDSLSQSSSGSLRPDDDDDDDDGNSLLNHFDTLASGLSDEKFDTDLKKLPPPVEEKHFLNPRLSISARFLSRFQDRLRAWPTRAPPPSVSIPARISEESLNASLSESTSLGGVRESGGGVRESGGGVRESGGGVSVRPNKCVSRRRPSIRISHQPHHQHTRRRRHTVVIRCREAAGDKGARPEVQPAALRLGYLGTTASTRARLGLDHPAPGSSPAPIPTSAQQEEINYLSSGLGQNLHPEPPETQDSRVAQLHPAVTQVLAPPTEVTSRGGATPTEVTSSGVATPTEVTSGGGARRWSVGSVETPTNQEQTLVSSPAPFIWTADDIRAEFITPAGAALLAPPPAPPTLQQCGLAASELCRAAHHFLCLLLQLRESHDLRPGGAEQCREMRALLQEVLDLLQAELQEVGRDPPGGPAPPAGPGAGGGPAPP